jgi:hypothetical protein
MNDPSTEVAEASAGALVQMGASLGEHIPLMALHLKAQHKQLRLLTIRTLCEIGTFSEAARQPLQECLGDADRTVVEAARQSLERIQRLTTGKS